MTLFHHGTNSYEDQAAKATEYAKGKLNDIIAAGSQRAKHVLEMVQQEVPQDHIVDGKKIEWTVGDRAVAKFGDHEFAMHPHALQQACSRVGMPMTYVRQLQKRPDNWAKQLMEHNLNELYKNAGERYLVRSVGDEARGFLSDSYRRYDSGKLIESFVGAVQKYNAVPVNGYYLSTKVAIKAMLPQVFQPVKNEVLGIGMTLQNSDFGDGAFVLNMFVMRLWCTNYAMSENALRKIHLGSKLPDNLRFSERTYELDTQTLSSMTQDIVDDCFTNKVDHLLEAVVDANEKEITYSQVNNFLKNSLTKKEAETVVSAMKGPDTYNMPEGQTAWRLSNALSWCAQSLDNEARQLDYMRLAGEAMKVGTRDKKLLTN